ncbi:MAG: type I methionyl aminopeptidase [Acidimicrobiia bacterium]|nr:type I methionyl aminopeptidase [Acidimicrobiia bacterium]
MPSPTAPPVCKPNDPCWCGSGKKFKRCHRPTAERVRAGRLGPRRSVPDHIEHPPYAESGEPVRWDEPLVKSPEVLDRMRRTGAAAAEILRTVGAAVAPGVTTDELDALAHEECIRLGGYPSPLNYRWFPKSLCTSVNEVICHGIPDDRALCDGDIVNLDVTLWREGVHGDTNATFCVGTVDPESRRLVTVTRECMDRGIDAVRPGLPINVIGRAIADHADANGCAVIRAFIGHGIGEQFHTDLAVPHYFEPRATTIMEPGMTFTIEPMISLGSWQHQIWDDGWTAVTPDHSRVAQFEHTLVVTDDGADILTVPTEGPTAADVALEQALGNERSAAPSPSLR